ncbi:MAG: hypothetical protein JL50_09280 [Peptococcaceae bacterium BICA1-7]|nr:MAG: hypothetical protein JL50_09280 [Peptococcaceae bacterium BICA1-7]HBV95472.1 molecular chaperone Hsp70 [Desulfotomaculum sp.]
MFKEEFENTARTQIKEDSTIFALDIGTRTVIGNVVAVSGESLRIVAQSITEHESRAVFDGQIHDIFKVAQAVRRVREDLEAKLGFKLKKVAIAAAGRSLKTRFAQIEQEIGDDIEIDPMICRGLEMDAVKEAHGQLREEAGDIREEEFYCVGYTVVNYYLNGYSITSLMGHSGRKIGVDVVATFLPNSVVNSLYSVLSRLNLEPISLTLEPIAAASAIIPDNYRLLNLALVDIGAGTSDIAITRDGSIVAYGMVPVAGDEITEALSQGFLADFNTAEHIKRQMAGGEDITFQDVMGIERKISCQEALEVLAPSLDNLADRITEEILKLNGNKSPKSIFCVGGGGQVPTFTGRVAERLGLSPDRVVLKGRKSIPGLLVDEEAISGPEGVTVVGIARVALDNVGHNFITININDKDYRLFHSRELTVFDALGLADYNLGDLMGKNGKDLRFVLNGERKVIYGELCKPAEVYINGETATLKSGLKEDDRITIAKAERGEDAAASPADFIGHYKSLLVQVNGSDEEALPQCFINGKKASPEAVIADGDRVEIREVKDAAGLAECMGYSLEHYGVFMDGREVSADKELSCGEKVEFRLKEQTASGSGDPVSPEVKSIEVTVNNNKTVLSGKNSYIFVDIFAVVNLDLSQISSGSKIKLIHNGQGAKYTDPVKEGDVIEVGWE